MAMIVPVFVAPALLYALGLVSGALAVLTVLLLVDLREGS